MIALALQKILSLAGRSKFIYYARGDPQIIKARHLNITNTLVYSHAMPPILCMSTLHKLCSLIYESRGTRMWHWYPCLEST